MVYVRDMDIDKKYTVDGVPLKLISKVQSGAGGSANQEPTFKLTFENNVTKTVDWDNVYDEVKGGGKKSKMRKTRKSRKLRRKKSIHNRKSYFY